MGSVSGFSVLSLDLCVHLSSISHCLDYWTFILSPKIVQHEFSNLVIFQSCLPVLVPLSFHTYFRISLLIATKKSWDFDWDYVESLDQVIIDILLARLPWRDMAYLSIYLCLP